MKINIDQLTTLFQTYITQLEQERAEIEALQTAHQRKEDEVNRRNAQLISERNATLAQVDTIRKQREEYEARMSEANKIKEIAREQVEKLEIRIGAVEAKAKELQEREDKVKQTEQRLAQVIKREVEIDAKAQTLDAERAFIAKQKEMLDEKQKAILIREEKLKNQEDRVNRLYN